MRGDFSISEGFNFGDCNTVFKSILFKNIDGLIWLVFLLGIDICITIYILIILLRIIKFYINRSDIQNLSIINIFEINYIFVCLREFKEFTRVLWIQLVYGIINQLSRYSNID